jgi:hypothetical protein
MLNLYIKYNTDPILCGVVPTTMNLFVVEPKQHTRLNTSASILYGVNVTACDSYVIAMFEFVIVTLIHMRKHKLAW